MDRNDSTSTIFEALHLIGRPKERALLTAVVDRNYRADADELQTLRPALARLVQHIESGRCYAVGVTNGETREMPGYVWEGATFELPAAVLQKAGESYSCITIQFITDADPIHEFGYPFSSAKVGLTLNEAFRFCGTHEELTLLDEFANHPGPALFSGLLEGYSHYDYVHDMWCKRARPIENRLVNRLRSGDWYVEGFERGSGCGSPVRVHPKQIEDADLRSWEDSVGINGANLDLVRVYPADADPAAAPRISLVRLSPAQLIPRSAVQGEVTYHPPAPNDLVRFANGKASITVGAAELTFHVQQSIVIKLQLDAHLAGKDWVLSSTLKKNGVKSSIYDLFKNYDWEEFIESSRGKSRLRVEALRPHPRSHP